MIPIPPSAAAQKTLLPGSLNSFRNRSTTEASPFSRRRRRCHTRRFGDGDGNGNDNGNDNDNDNGNGYRCGSESRLSTLKRTTLIFFPVRARMRSLPLATSTCHSKRGGVQTAPFRALRWLAPLAIASLPIGCA